MRIVLVRVLLDRFFEGQVRLTIPVVGVLIPVLDAEDSPVVGVGVLGVFERARVASVFGAYGGAPDFDAVAGLRILRDVIFGRVVNLYVLRLAVPDGREDVELHAAVGRG